MTCNSSHNLPEVPLPDVQEIAGEGGNCLDNEGIFLVASWVGGWNGCDILTCVDAPSTIWTQIRAAQRNSTGAWNGFYERYQSLISRQIFRRIKGITEADREDLLQNVFVQVSREDFLERADKEKGRFRSLLFAVTDNVIRMWLRGEYSRRRKGDEKVVSLGQEELFGVLQNKEGVDSGEQKEFNREWATQILQDSMETLRAESRRLGTDYHRALQAHYFDDVPTPELAVQMGVTEETVHNYLSRGRKKLGDAIRAVVREYCSDEEELNEELRDLQHYLPLG